MKARIVLLTFILTYFIWIIYAKHEWVTSSKNYCEYKLPAQYFVIQDKSSKKYGVVFMHIDVYPYYLREVKCISLYPDYSIFDGTADQVTLFTDSCQAKRLAHQAILHELERAKKSVDLKIVNN